MNNNKKHDWFRSITGITLSIAVIFLSWAAVSWASLTNFMEVKHIKILNHHFISENDYRLIVEKYVNNESNTIDLELIRNAVESHPFVKGVRVSKQFPQTVQIEIVERNPLAIIRTNTPVLVDGECIILPIVNKEIELYLPSLTKFNSLQSLYTIGEPTKSKNISESVTYIKYIKNTYPELYQNLSEFRLNQHEEFELILEKEPTLVILGKSNIKNRLDILQEFDKILPPSREITNYRYLDFRYENQVIAREWRS